MKFFQKNDGSPVQGVPVNLFEALSADNKKLLGKEVEVIHVRDANDHGNTRVVLKSEWDKYGEAEKARWVQYDPEADHKGILKSVIEQGLPKDTKPAAAKKAVDAIVEDQGNLDLTSDKKGK